MHIGSSLKAFVSHLLHAQELLVWEKLTKQNKMQQMRKKAPPLVIHLTHLLKCNHEDKVCPTSHMSPRSYSQMLRGIWELLL